MDAEGDIAMWKSALVLVGFALASSVLLSTPASAQATRTWISGVGDDANPCSRTAPCKTWAGAISKTASGGEIDALDPGGFGALTITKSITLDGGGGQVASVLVAGTNGISVAAGSSDVVIIRNIRLNGLLGNGSNPSGAGINGISFISGAELSIENCWIFGFNAAGINANTTANSTLNISNTNITNAVNGINLVSSANLFGTIDHTAIQNTSGNGIMASGSGAINFTITNSVITGTSTAVNAGGSQSILSVDTSSVANNTTGFNASVSGAYIRISNNTIYNNPTTFAIAGGATIATWGTNRATINGSTVPNSTLSQQ
jgi:hypothetical protein